MMCKAAGSLGVCWTSSLGERLQNGETQSRTERVQPHTRGFGPTSAKGRRHRELPLPKEACQSLAACLRARPSDQGEHPFVGLRLRLDARGIQMHLTALGQAAVVE